MGTSLLIIEIEYLIVMFSLNKTLYILLIYNLNKFLIQSNRRTKMYKNKKKLPKENKKTA